MVFKKSDPPAKKGASKKPPAKKGNPFAKKADNCKKCK